MRSIFLSYRVIVIYTLFLSSVFCFAKPSVAVTEAASHKEYLQALLVDCFDIGKNSRSTLLRKRRLLRSRLQEELDLEWSARTALGRYWSQYSAVEQQAFLLLYNQYLIKTCLRNLAQADFNVPPQVSNRIIVVNKTDKQVACSFQTVHGKKISIVLLVRDYGVAGHRILDVNVEGMSIAVSCNRQFTKLIERYGLKALMPHLRAMIENSKNIPQQKVVAK